MAGPAITSGSGVAATSTTSGSKLAANQKRVRLVLTNPDATDTIYVLFGTGTASSSSCHVVLGPGVGWDAEGDLCPREAVIAAASANTPSLVIGEWAN